MEWVISYHSSVPASNLKKMEKKLVSLKQFKHMTYHRQFSSTRRKSENAIMYRSMRQNESMTREPRAYQRERNESQKSPSYIPLGTKKPIKSKKPVMIISIHNVYDLNLNNPCRRINIGYKATIGCNPYPSESWNE
jgi:hypothetical protein